MQAKKDGELEEVIEHPILDLLENPSRAHDGETMPRTYAHLLEPVGEAYALS